MRFLDKLIALAVIVFLAGQLIGAWEDRRAPEAPRRAPPPAARVEPPMAPAAPAATADWREIRRQEAALPDVGRGRVGEIEREGGPRRRGETSTGTAWPVGDGVWATARHVAEECGAIRFRDTRWAEPRVAFRDPDVDLMGFRTSERRETPLALSPRPPARDAAALAVGYPKGKPAVAELRLIGTSRIRYEGGQPFLAYYWEVTRVPDAFADRNLAGISGGPVIDGAGRTIGVAIFGNDRRGTLGTVALSDLRRNADPHAQSAAATPVAVSAAAALLSTRRVEQVVCRR
jgi:S1-C subfamily serine protease